MYHQFLKTKESQKSKDLATTYLSECFAISKISAKKMVPLLDNTSSESWTFLLTIMDSLTEKSLLWQPLLAALTTSSALNLEIIVFVGQ